MGGEKFRLKLTQPSKAGDWAELGNTGIFSAKQGEQHLQMTNNDLITIGSVQLGQ